MMHAQEAAAADSRQQTAAAAQLPSPAFSLQQCVAYYLSITIIHGELKVLRYCLAVSISSRRVSVSVSYY